MAPSRLGFALVAATLLLAFPAASASAGRRMLRAAAPAPAVGNTEDATHTLRRLSQISANLKDSMVSETNIVGIPKSQAPPGYMGKIMAPSPVKEAPKEAAAASTGSAAASGATATAAATGATASLGPGQQPRSLPGAGPDAATPAVAQRGPGDQPGLTSAPGVHSAGGQEAAFHDAHGNVVAPVSSAGRESAFAANGAPTKGIDAAPPKDAQVKWVQFGAYGNVQEFSERPTASP
jgi:hypothetical protein